MNVATSTINIAVVCVTIVILCCLGKMCNGRR